MNISTNQTLVSNLHMKKKTVLICRISEILNEFWPRWEKWVLWCVVQGQNSWTTEKIHSFLFISDFVFWDRDSLCRCVWSLCLLLRAGILGVYVAPHTENAGLLVEIFSLFNYTQSEITVWPDSENLIKTLLGTSAWVLLK